MGVVYIDYHSLIVVFGISDWMCHFSIGHSMSIIWLTSQMRIVSTLSLFGVLVFLICCVLNFVLIPQTWQYKVQNKCVASIRSQLRDELN